MEPPAARRFAFQELPGGGGHRFRVRRSFGSQGCTATLVFAVFSAAWILAARRLLETARDRRVDSTGAGVLALVLPFLLLFWYLGPNTWLFATRVEIGGSNLRVRRWFRWRTYACAEIAVISRVVQQSNLDSHDPRLDGKLDFACRIEMKNGGALELGHGQPPEDLAWLAGTLRTLAGLPQGG